LWRVARGMNRTKPSSGTKKFQMSHSPFLRTAELARAAGISVQQVRNYEAWGILPAATRSASGYRQYTQRHLHALRTARTLMAGYGWEPARQLMAALHKGDEATVFAAVDARHAELDSQRRRAEQTLRALRDVSGGRADHEELCDDIPIGAAARQLGVRPSALRYWEGLGLVAPLRDKTSGYRRYNEEQLRQLEALMLMRHNGYAAPVIALVLAELAAGRPEQAITAAEQRLRDLHEASRRCAQATAALWQYIEGDPP
jgi:DNA-binding transcriptional MerR regulator